MRAQAGCLPSTAPNWGNRHVCGSPGTHLGQWTQQGKCTIDVPSVFARPQRRTQERLERRAAALARMRTEGDLFALMSTLRMDYLRQTGAYCARWDSRVLCGVCWMN